MSGEIAISCWCQHRGQLNRKPRWATCFKRWTRCSAIAWVRSHLDLEKPWGNSGFSTSKRWREGKYRTTWGWINSNSTSNWGNEMEWRSTATGAILQQKATTDFGHLEDMLLTWPIPIMQAGETSGLCCRQIIQNLFRPSHVLIFGQPAGDHTQLTKWYRWFLTPWANYCI